MNGEGHVSELQDCLSPEMTAHIIENIKPGKEMEELDKAWWTVTQKVYSQ